MHPLLSRTRIVLIAPSLPDNVGAVARSMANFGFSELVLVGGVSPTDPRALTLAAGYETVLHTARCVNTLEAALEGATLVLGTTARDWNGIDRAAIEPREAADLARAHAEHGPVALVFGTEKHGMSNEDLRRCHQVVTIPGEPDTCLNLAMAATVLLYEWRQAALTGSPDAEPPVTALAAEEGVSDLAGWLVGGLAAYGLIKPKETERKAHTLRRVLSRARLSADEAAMVAGLIRAALRRQDPAARPGASAASKESDRSP